MSETNGKNGDAKARWASVAVTLIVAAGASTGRTPGNRPGAVVSICASRSTKYATAGQEPSAISCNLP